MASDSKSHGLQRASTTSEGSQWSKEGVTTSLWPKIPMNLFFLMPTGGWRVGGIVVAAHLCKRRRFTLVVVSSTWGLNSHRQFDCGCTVKLLRTPTRHQKQTHNNKTFSSFSLLGSSLPSTSWPRMTDGLGTPVQRYHFPKVASNIPWNTVKTVIIKRRKCSPTMTLSRTSHLSRQKVNGPGRLPRGRWQHWRTCKVFWQVLCSTCENNLLWSSYDRVMG